MSIFDRKRTQLTLPRTALDDPYAEHWRAIERWANNLGTYTTHDSITAAQSASLTLTDSSVYYTQLSDFFHCHGYIVFGSAGTPGTELVLNSFPFLLYDDIVHSLAVGENTGYVAGNAIFTDVSAAPDNVFHLAMEVAASGVVFKGYNENGLFGIDPAITVASGDLLAFNMIYRIQIPIL